MKMITVDKADGHGLAVAALVKKNHCRISEFLYWGPLSRTLKITSMKRTLSTRSQLLSVSDRIRMEKFWLLVISQLASFALNCRNRQVTARDIALKVIHRGAVFKLPAVCGFIAPKVLCWIALFCLPQKTDWHLMIVHDTWVESYSRMFGVFIYG